MFEADLDPKTLRPRLRFRFNNGRTGSLVLSGRVAGGCTYAEASFAEMGGTPLKVIGAIQTDLSADEAAVWLEAIRAKPMLEGPQS